MESILDTAGQATATASFGQHAPRPKVALVTGGAGFLGSLVCERLIYLGYRVVCIDNFMSGRLVNIASLLKHPRFSLVEHDIIAPLNVNHAVDRIYNLACPASPPTYQKDPLHTFKTCVLGGINMLNLARDKGARILQASTSEVYGDPKVSPQNEDYLGNVNTFGPRACYDEGKRAAETLFYDYFHNEGVDIRVARIFNTYGPKMCPQDGRVISNFVTQALAGKDLTVMGDGSQTRSFCYREDLVDGLMRLMEVPGALPRPVNLGRPDEYTVLDIARTVLSMTGSSSAISFCALPVHDPRQRRPDITLAQNLLGWSPTTRLDKGLALTIDHFRREMDQGLRTRAVKV